MILSGLVTWVTLANQGSIVLAMTLLRTKAADGGPCLLSRWNPSSFFTAIAPKGMETLGVMKTFMKTHRPSELAISDVHILSYGTPEGWKLVPTRHLTL